MHGTCNIDASFVQIETYVRKKQSAKTILNISLILDFAACFASQAAKSPP